MAVNLQPQWLQQCIGPRRRGLQINAAVGGQSARSGSQRVLVQACIKGGIEKQHVLTSTRQLAQGRHPIAALYLHDLRQGLWQFESQQLRPDLLQLLHQRTVLLHQQDFARTARGRFEAQGAGACEGINTTQSLQILPKPVE